MVGVAWLRVPAGWLPPESLVFPQPPNALTPLLGLISAQLHI